MLFQVGGVSLLAGGFHKPAGVVVLSIVIQFYQGGSHLDDHFISS